MNSLARTLAERLIVQKCEYRGGNQRATLEIAVTSGDIQ